VLSRENIQKLTPPTRFWSKGGVVGVLTRKNDPPTRVCSEGGSVSIGCVMVMVVIVLSRENNPTDSLLKQGWGCGCVDA
jgi:hypothetical protein